MLRVECVQFCRVKSQRVYMWVGGFEDVHERGV